MKTILFLIFVLLFTGCTNREFNSVEYNNYVLKYGADTRYFCENGFLIVEQYVYKTDIAPTRSVVCNNASVPTRCEHNNTTIQVKETVATGSLVRSVK